MRYPFSERNSGHALRVSTDSGAPEVFAIAQSPLEMRGSDRRALFRLRYHDGPGAEITAQNHQPRPTALADIGPDNNEHGLSRLSTALGRLP
jgi:hypothetical protein